MQSYESCFVSQLSINLNEMDPTQQGSWTYKRGEQQSVATSRYLNKYVATTLSRWKMGFTRYLNK